MEKTTPSRKDQTSDKKEHASPVTEKKERVTPVKFCTKKDFIKSNMQSIQQDSRNVIRTLKSRSRNTSTRNTANNSPLMKPEPWGKSKDMLKRLLQDSPVKSIDDRIGQPFQMTTDEKVKPTRSPFKKTTTEPLNKPILRGTSPIVAKQEENRY